MWRPRPRDSASPLSAGTLPATAAFFLSNLSVAFSADDREGHLGMAWALPGGVCTLSGHLRGRSDHRAASLVPSPQRH